MYRPADVTVVIAALNEAPTIGEIVMRCRPLAREVIVVDGHSDDGTDTRAEAAGARVLRDGGRGKGDAIRTAIPQVTTAVTVFIDADASHDPGDIPRLVAPITDGVADHVTGSRLLGGSSELHGGFDEFFRLAGSSFVTACFNWKFGVRLSDSQNGFRAIRTSVLQALHLGEDTTTIEQEMILETLRRGYRMAEVPSHEHARRYGTSHIRVATAAHRYAWSLLRGVLGPTGPRATPVVSTAAAEPSLKPSLAGNSNVSRR